MTTPRAALGSGTRNGCLARALTAGAGFFVLFRVPAEQTVLLKAVHVWNSTGSPVLVTARATASSGAVSAYLISEEVPAGAFIDWAGWIGLNPSDVLECFTGAPGVALWASGALLPGSADLPLPSSGLAEQWPIGQAAAT